jgi:hypothetical protein
MGTGERIIHRDEPGCDCGRCEPAEGGNVLGALMSGNPGCDAPSCIIMGAACRWGAQPCMDLTRYPSLPG